ncbi:hypothetical protein ACP70R_043796 [Stipagrostis hirtigluma subsp. patula]
MAARGVGHGSARPCAAAASGRRGVVYREARLRSLQVRGDVEQLLWLGHPDRALLRAEQVIREQNALDTLLMLEAYCNLVAERAALLKVRRILAAKFGKDFVSAASDLRSGCDINTKRYKNMEAASGGYEVARWRLLGARLPGGERQRRRRAEAIGRPDLDARRREAVLPWRPAATAGGDEWLFFKKNVGKRFSQAGGQDNRLWKGFFAQAGV